MRRLGCVLVAVGLLACKSKQHLPWGPHVIKEVTYGTYTIPIPAGWRDMKELQDDRLRSTIPPNTVALALEDFGGGRFFPNVMISWVPGGNRVTCATYLAQAVNGVTASNSKDVVVGGLPGCTMELHAAKVFGTGLVVFTPDHQLTIQCVRDISGDAALDAACRKVLDGLNVQPAAADPDLQVGAVIETRYKVLRWLGATSSVVVVEVVHLRVPTATGKVRVLITTRKDATADQRKAFRDAGMREIGLGQQGKGNLPVDEVDSLGGDLRTFVISSLTQAELDDVLAGRRVIGK